MNKNTYYWFAISIVVNEKLTGLEKVEFSLFLRTKSFVGTYYAPGQKITETKLNNN